MGFVFGVGFILKGGGVMVCVIIHLFLPTSSPRDFPLPPAIQLWSTLLISCLPPFSLNQLRSIPLIS